MTFEDFLGKLAIPGTCEVDKNIFKKFFYEKGELKYSDKRIFTSDVDKITWLFTLKEDTIPIKAYRDEEKDYTEIAIIQVLLKKRNHYQRIADIMQRTIPYPLLIIFLVDNRVLINVAHKRVNKQDQAKATYEELIFTKWINLDSLNNVEQNFIDSLVISDFSYMDFYKFYSDIMKRVISFNVACVTGDYEMISDNEIVSSEKIIDEIDELKEEKEHLKYNLKKETQFNKKVHINMKIKNIDKKINQLKQKL